MTCSIPFAHSRLWTFAGCQENIAQLEASFGDTPIGREPQCHPLATGGVVLCHCMFSAAQRVTQAWCGGVGAIEQLQSVKTTVLVPFEGEARGDQENTMIRGRHDTPLAHEVGWIRHPTDPWVRYDVPSISNEETGTAAGRRNQLAHEDKEEDKDGNHFHELAREQWCVDLNVTGFVICRSMSVRCYEINACAIFSPLGELKFR